MESVTFPDTLEVINDDPFFNIPIRKLFIPASVKTMSERNPFNALPNLERIDVDPSNQYYTSVDGVLYNKDMSLLIQYPRNNKISIYIVAKSVKVIGMYCFCMHKGIRTIVLQNSLNKIEQNSFLYTDDLILMIPYTCKIENIVNSTYNLVGILATSIIGYYNKIESKQVCLFSFNSRSQVFLYTYVFILM